MVDEIAEWLIILFPTRILLGVLLVLAGIGFGGLLLWFAGSSLLGGH